MFTTMSSIGLPINGLTRSCIDYDMVVIGFESVAQLGGVAIGNNAHAGVNAVALGTNSKAPDGHVVILNIDFTNIASRLEQLENIIAEQQEMIQALWYHPGMPGAVDAASSFAINRDRSVSGN